MIKTLIYYDTEGIIKLEDNSLPDYGITMYKHLCNYGRYIGSIVQYQSSDTYIEELLKLSGVELYPEYSNDHINVFIKTLMQLDPTYNVVEECVFKNPTYAYRYASVRDIELPSYIEEYLLENLNQSRLVAYAINNKEGRWKEMEHTLSRDYEWAMRYAIHKIKYADYFYKTNNTRLILFRSREPSEIDRVFSAISCRIRHYFQYTLDMNAKYNMTAIEVPEDSYQDIKELISLCFTVYPVIDESFVGVITQKTIKEIIEDFGEEKTKREFNKHHDYWLEYSYYKKTKGV